MARNEPVLFAAGKIFVADYNVLVNVIDAYDLLIILTNNLATLQEFKFENFALRFISNFEFSFINLFSAELYSFNNML